MWNLPEDGEELGGSQPASHDAEPAKGAGEGLPEGHAAHQVR
jgi:hypothetical protein